MGRSDAGRKVATTMEPYAKVQLNKLAIREGVNLSTYVRKVLFDHVQQKAGSQATSRAVKTGSIEHFEEASN